MDGKSVVAAHKYLCTSIRQKLASIENGIAAASRPLVEHSGSGYRSVSDAKAEVLRLDTDLLTDDQCKAVFGPQGPSRTFDRFVEMRDSKTGIITKHKIQDWASESYDMIQSTDPYLSDFEACKTETEIIEFGRRHQQPAPTQLQID